MASEDGRRYRSRCSRCSFVGSGGKLSPRRLPLFRPRVPPPLRFAASDQLIEPSHFSEFPGYLQCSPGARLRFQE